MASSASAAAASSSTLQERINQGLYEKVTARTSEVPALTWEQAVLLGKQHVDALQGPGHERPLPNHEWSKTFARHMMEVYPQFHEKYYMKKYSNSHEDRSMSSLLDVAAFMLHPVHRNFEKNPGRASWLSDQFLYRWNNFELWRHATRYLEQRDLEDWATAKRMYADKTGYSDFRYRFMAPNNMVQQVDVVTLIPYMQEEVERRKLTTKLQRTRALDNFQERLGSDVAQLIGSMTIREKVPIRPLKTEEERARLSRTQPLDGLMKDIVPQLQDLTARASAGSLGFNKLRYELLQLAKQMDAQERAFVQQHPRLARSSASASEAKRARI